LAAGLPSTAGRAEGRERDRAGAGARGFGAAAGDAFFTAGSGFFAISRFATSRFAGATGATAFAGLADRGGRPLLRPLGGPRSGRGAGVSSLYGESSVGRANLVVCG
jgi:hypothetical protein